ncbi:MAG TPA: glycosyltransferase family 2 protein [bacterium]|nr:glycosyltransferase family 2 protein [bacterium]HPL95646.1 glycosyltransferase family 2 protein [bacterium]
MPNIFIIVPAFNEEKNIIATLNDLLPLGHNIVVVDDGSNDQTLAMIKKMPVIALSHKINRGQGAALATGTAYALKQNADFIIHFDADGQFLAHELTTFIQPLLNNSCDIVLGSRFKNKNHVPWFKKNLIHPVAKIVDYLFTGLKLTDAHCGLRAMNRLAAEKIVITQDGMSHNTEIVAQIKKNNLRFLELPATVIYKEFGQGIGGGIKIVRDLIINKIIN